jgi:hypothetical protein
MRAGRLAMVMVGGLLTLVGFGALAGGAALVAVHATQRDNAGYYHLAPQRLETSTAALVTPVELGPMVSDYPLGTVQIRIASSGSGPVFVGIGPADQVRAWLSGVAYAQVADWGVGPTGPRTAPVPGTRAAPPPATAAFWLASASGQDEATVSWPTRAGDWAVVVMNTTGQPGVVADVGLASDTGILLPAGLVAGGFGALVLALGIALALIAVRRPDGWPGPAALASAPGSYPVRLDGRLEPGLSRWLWLVKWFLAIPHSVVLGLLWLAALPLTVVAGFAILFTGRYPRDIFEFNVGVMRWTWRVSYYTFGALGTDRYPPFALDPDPGYPADLSVDYPARLSRGLVLVKWWLLALPHLIIVALLVGGWAGAGLDQWWFGLSGGGLIGVMVLVAAIVLAITGSYPSALFDVVMGLNRWCYRVFAYVALMRDEYPPFRFDAGGPDPGTVPVPPPPEPPGPGSAAGELVGSSSTEA